MLGFRVSSTLVGRAAGVPLQISLDQGGGEAGPEFLTMQRGFAAEPSEPLVSGHPASSLAWEAPQELHCGSSGYSLREADGLGSTMPVATTRHWALRGGKWPAWVTHSGSRCWGCL